MRTALPALSTSRSARLTVLISLYVGQGLPQGLLVVALPAYLAEAGASAEAVGAFVALVLLPFPLKVLVGPVLDRYTFGPMGRRRPWVLAGGLGIVASLLAMAALGGGGDLAWLTAAGVAVNVFVSVMDVAVDGMAVDVVPVDEQPQANALMWGAATLGVAVSAVGTSRLLDSGGVAPAALALAIGMGALLFAPLVLRERPGERLLPWTRGAAAPRGDRPVDWRDLIGRLVRSAVLPASLSLLAAVVVAGALDGLVIAYLPVLAVQTLGWADTDYSNLVAVGQVAAGLVAMGLGSVLIQRVGRVRMAVGLALALGVVLATMALAEGAWAQRAVVVAFGFGYLGVFVLMTVTLLATAMALCGRTVGATQFALFTAAMNVGRSSGSGAAGWAAAHLSAPGVFAAVAVAAVVVALLVRRVDVEAHRSRQAALDARALAAS